jgi:hypothetical protein
MRGDMQVASGDAWGGSVGWGTRGDTRLKS